MRKAISLSLLLLTVILIVQQLSVSDQPRANDFLEYWASATLLLHGRNPYSPANMVELQRQIAPTRQSPLLLYLPPWSFPLFLAGGLTGYAHGLLFWDLFRLVVVFFCADVLWRHYEGAPRRRWISWVISLTFLPTLVVLGLGQIGPLILLGVVLFLRWHDSRPFWAGAALVLVVAKPQLLFLFAAAVFIWMVRERRWKIAAGFLAGILACTTVAVLFRPAILQDYATFTRATPILFFPATTLGFLAAYKLHLQAWWVYYLGVVVGIAWLVPYMQWKRSEWDWNEQVCLLVLLSLLLTPYGWYFDQIVLLPVLFRTVMLIRQRSWKWRGFVYMAYAVLSGLAFVLILRQSPGVAYWWTVPCWIAVYAIAQSPEWERRAARTALLVV